MAGSDGGEVQVYRSKEISFERKSIQSIESVTTFHADGMTRFQQGELGNCWLATAMECLRQGNNKEDFNKVVPADGNNLEFRFWQEGRYQHSVLLDNDEVPTRDGNLVFMRNVEGTEFWGILLEKAYAKWLGSYEDLDGGFWSDAMQSFTGGVVERIELQEDEVPNDLFDIMLTSYQDNSYLCCIMHDPDNIQSKKEYHSCSIKIETGDTREIWVRDPYNQELNIHTFEEFISKYHRLDMCHQNLDNLSALHGRKIGSSPWESQMFSLGLENCATFSITLTDTDDDDEKGCTFVIELVQKIKPSEGQSPNHRKLWEVVVDLELKVEGKDPIGITFPQEVHCFTLEPGTHDIKVTTDAEDHSEIFMRIFSKRKYQVESKQ